MLGESEKQAAHEFLYWEDPKSTAVRMGTWKAVRPGKGKPFELYDLNKDIEELSDVAAKHPDVLAKMTGYAGKASTPPRTGKVLDASKAFNVAKHRAKKPAKK